jgi:hypothetical protein
MRLPDGQPFQNSAVRRKRRAVQPMGAAGVQAPDTGRE